MHIVTILALAIALAMDAFAVALTAGIQLRFISMRQTIRMAGVFGFFQFFMPVVGWFVGIEAHHYIKAYDHWLAFALLLVVGGKMLHEAWENRGKEEVDCQYSDPTAGSVLWLLGVATSLDALAVGLSLALVDINVWFPAVIIGIVCFVFTAFGLHLGRLICMSPRLGSLGNISNKANVLGGGVLIVIGLGILYDHGVFSVI